MNTKNFHKFQKISTNFTKYISTNFNLFRSRPRTYFNKFLSSIFNKFRGRRPHISRPQAAYFYKFLSISLYFSLFLSFSLFAQQDNLEVKGTLKCDSLTIQGGTSDPSSPVKGTLFYRSDKKKFYIFDGENWQEIGGGSIDKTVASQIVGTTSSRYGSDKPCDGTSDQVEIQQAIDDLGDNKGAVYLLEGTYNLDGTIALNNTSPLDSNKSIIGTGAGTVLKVATDASGINVIYFCNADNTMISRLKIDGNSRTGSNNFGVYARSKYCLIDDLWITDMKHSGILLVYSDKIVYGTYISDSGKDGITYNGWPGRNIIATNNIHNVEDDGIISWENSIISGNSLQSNKDSNIWLSSGCHIVLGNNLESTKYGVFISGGYNIIVGNYSSSANWGLIYGTRSLLSSNILYSNSYGFWSSSVNFTFLGNLISESGALGSFPGVNLQTYYVTTPKSDLISSNLIYDSTFTGTGINNYGIKISSGDQLYLVGNLIFGSAYYNPTASPPVERRVKDAGTSTRYTDKLKITLQEGEYTHTGNTISLSGPASYLRLNHSSNITVNTIQKTAGTFAVGDILILENTTAHRVILNEAGNFCLHTSPLNLYQNDTLALVYDGTNWIETGYSDN